MLHAKNIGLRLISNKLRKSSYFTSHRGLVTRSLHMKSIFDIISIMSKAHRYVDFKLE